MGQRKRARTEKERVGEGFGGTVYGCTLQDGNKTVPNSTKTPEKGLKKKVLRLPVCRSKPPTLFHLIQTNQ